MPYPTALIKIGFVPLLDCAPLVLAKELGYFKEHGLHVQLVREPGWASIRDKVAYGELAAAHALAGLCFAISWGQGVVSRPCLTGLLFNSHGDAVTLASKFIDAGVTDAISLESYVQTEQRRLTFGIPHLFSSHHFLLRQWLRSGNLVPGKEVELVVLPPSQMNACLEEGFLDGFCVGEPFNTTASRNDSGSVMATSVDLVPMHPEKAFLVTEDFAEKRPEDHFALIQAITQACQLCDTDDGREQVARILSQRSYLNCDEKLLHGSLGADRPEFHLFHGDDVNAPSKDKANWLITQMRLSQVIDKNHRYLPAADQIFREDIYRASVGTAISA
ncbi:MAG: CmpA/NrtA family ABC transporter substrate-binding protein [Verrucomicrobiales bacterium]|nr:ABC transporter substrate-binding protein [Verrucomicrobiaceae bacterium]